ncbi:MAG: response regulator, partial [Deltaproteobacteria bacterium]
MMTGAVPNVVLIVEDDADARANLSDILELDGYTARTTGTFAEAMARTDWDDFLAIILDRRLPDGTADEFLPRLRQAAPAVPVIVVTGFADVEGTIAALRQGAQDYIVKPIDADTFRARLARIAENRRDKEALKKSEAALEVVLASAPCMIVILDTGGKIRYFSPYAEQLTGYSAKDVLGQNYLSLFIADGALQQSIQKQLQHNLEGTPTLGYENPILCRNGTSRSMVWNARLLSDYLGEPGVLAVGQDITTLKQAQEQVLQSERLAAIGQMMAGLAHESRNALQRSQACLEMLGMEVHDRPPALDLVARIQKAQDHLHLLYEEVRDYAAPIRLRCDDHDLRAVLDDTWENLTAQRAGRDARLEYPDGEGRMTCRVDRFAIEQVFRNVLENSLSACDDPVRIAARFRAARLGDRPAIEVSLADNGPGLAMEARARIFEPFFTTKTRGTGLGMAISRRIVEAHG